MLRLTLTLPFLLALGLPADAQSLDALAGPETVWVLDAIDGVAFEASATLSFAEAGSVSGDGPCNSYSGTVSGTAQAFTVGPLAVTRMACPDLDAETNFTTALARMTKAEMTDSGLILTGPKGHQMLFVEDVSE